MHKLQIDDIVAYNNELCVIAKLFTDGDVGVMPGKMKVRPEQITLVRKRSSKVYFYGKWYTRTATVAHESDVTLVLRNAYQIRHISIKHREFEKGWKRRNFEKNKSG
jgi:hypothetical protein